MVGLERFSPIDRSVTNVARGNRLMADIIGSNVRYLMYFTVVDSARERSHDDAMLAVSIYLLMSATVKTIMVSQLTTWFCRI